MNSNRDEKLNADYELRKNWPSIKFREYLLKDKIWWTNNWEEFYLLQEMKDYEAGEYKSYVTAAVGIEYLTNPYLDLMTVQKHFLHINYITVRTDWRGLGALNTISQLLIRGAEDTGIVLLGHARPFNIDLPEITNQEQALHWQENNKSSHNLSLKKDKANAKKLLPKYLEYGFCKYDGHGIRFSNRWWKKMCFGYSSSKINDYEVNKYIQEHMYC